MIKRFIDKNLNKLILILFCIFVFTVFLLPNLSAKYLSSNSDGDNGRTSVYYFDIQSEAMAYNVDLDFDFDPTMTIDSGNQKEIIVVVNGTSETKVYVNAKAKFMGNLPLATSSVSYQINGDTEKSFTGSQLANTLRATNPQTEFAEISLLPIDTIEIAPNTSSNQIVSFKFNIGWTSDDDYKSYVYENGVEYLQIEVTTTQVD